MIKVNLQLFGGRGASSSASGGGSASGGNGKTLEYYLEGKSIEGTPEGAREQATEFLAAAQNVFDDFGMNGFSRVTFNEDRGSLFGSNAAAAVNGFNQVTINKKAITSPQTNSNGYFTSDTIAGTGAHEAGHAVINELINNKVMPGATNLQKATARHDGKLEKAIIRESKKRFGSNPPISGYGSTSAIEKVAEAFSDVYANGKRANPYSQTIVNVARDINNGTFNPKLRY